MKRLTHIAAALAVVSLSSVASAQAITLDFNDLPTTASFFEAANVNYRGFNFSSATGTQDSSWFWAPGDARFVSGAGPANNNNVSGAVANAPIGQYDAFVVSSHTPFMFHSAFFSGGCDTACGTPIFLQLLTTAGDLINLGGFDDAVLDPATATFTLPKSGGLTYFNTTHSSTQLTEFAIWAPSGSFSMDDVVVTPVPEPGTYGLMALGLVGVGLMVRRRQQDKVAA